MALASAIEFILNAGVQNIAAHVASLQRALLDALEVTAWGAEAARLRGLLSAGRIGAILSFHHGGRGAQGLGEVLHSARAHRVYASVREGYLRVALHGWHDNTDVARIVAWLKGI